MNKTAVGIVGASGYSGQELIRLLLRHPQADIVCYTSRQYSGRAVASVFPQFRGLTDAKFVESSPETVAGDVVFLALPHGVAAEYAATLLARGKRVIDLSADFRLKSPATYREFYEHEHPAPHLLAKSVYGLPEFYRDAIRTAELIACPGCYPTSILLGALPALRLGLAEPTGIVISSLSGVSGAGRKVAEEYLFCEVNESARAYGIPKHRHLSEIEEQLGVTVSFTPHLVPLNRGILTTIYLTAKHASHALEAYREFYRQEPFVRVLENLPDTKYVERTNFCDISVRHDPRTGRLVIVSALDNLTKGAAGQAVQCFNLACGYEETTGLL
ncbi:MAG: N-acetyl-gamma-glutamyl-phosphate reductase [Verrucomicrobiae bacterium]|nr:N-acetyl-gamma-glutamyl-phosphate reductase [Verrucomicrobiae bacterium]